MASGKKGTIRFIKKTFSAEFTSLASGGRKTFTASDLGYSIPEGYMPIGIPYFTASILGVHFAKIELDGSENVTIINNTSSSAKSGTVVITVIFAPIDWAETPPDFLNPVT